MKKIIYLCLALSLFADIFANVQEVPSNIHKILMDKFCPKPLEVKFFEGFYLLSENSNVEISTPQEFSKDEKRLIEATFKNNWGFVPKIEFKSDAKYSNFDDEESSIKIDGELLSLGAKNFKGINYALISIRQLAEAEHDSKNFILQRGEIKDAPALKFRGIHLCLFPETTAVAFEKYIRLAAYYKFNYAVIEYMGTFPFESHPEFAHADKKRDKAELKRIIDLCYQLGITPIPNFSIFGHASQSSERSGKHAFLVKHPELANLFEPYGWSWCLSNPKSSKILKDLVCELHEFFGNPPFFHINCDEAHDKGTCYKCRNDDMAKLFSNHLIKFNKLINSRGARTIMWHDMLLDSQDPRWKIYTAYGDKDTAATIDSLPKNIIIADWQYSSRDPNTSEFPTPKYFKDKGFDVIVCPWETLKGIVTLANTAKDEKLFGYLGTTWHRMSGVRPRNYFYFGANSAWCKNYNVSSRKSAAVNFNLHMATIERDMKIERYEDLGTTELQIYDDVFYKF